MTVPAADAAERQVLRWFVIALLAAAVVLIAVSWWRTARACRVSCEAQGKPAAHLEFKGGGRFELGTTCVCGGDAGGR